MNDVMRVDVVDTLKNGPNDGGHFIVGELLAGIPPFLDEIFEGSVPDDFHS